jgi:hypothetical protein
LSQDPIHRFLVDDAIERVTNNQFTYFLPFGAPKIVS